MNEDQLAPVLKDKYNQLNLPFNKFKASAPIKVDNILKVNQLYIPTDFLHFPFFFQKGSEMVVNSRKLYLSDDENKEIPVKKSDMHMTYTDTGDDSVFDDLSDSSKTKDANPSSKQSKSGKATPSQSQNLSSTTHSSNKQDNSQPIEQDTHYEITKEWHVIAHHEYGLPDTFDGQVWDILLQNISYIYKRTKSFYQYYYFSVNYIAEEMRRLGYIKAKSIGGRQRQKIKDSLMRLQYTKYKQVNRGFYRNDQKHNLQHYSLNLITAIYWKEEQIPGGKYFNKTAIAIDPLTLINFLHKNYFITSNVMRCKLIEYKSKSLHDKLSYICSKNLQNSTFIHMKRANLKPFAILNYSTLCTFLGYKQLIHKNRKPKEIRKQFRKIHDELEQNEIIEEFLIHKYNGYYRIVYIYTESFLNQVYQLFSNRQKLDFKDLSDNEIERIYKFINSLNLSTKIREKIGVIKAK